MYYIPVHWVYLRFLRFGRLKKFSSSKKEFVRDGFLKILKNQYVKAKIPLFLGISALYNPMYLCTVIKDKNNETNSNILRLYFRQLLRHCG